MWLTEIDRSEFINLFSKDTLKNEIKVKNIKIFPKIEPHADSFYAIWEEKPTGQFNLPNLFIVNDGKHRDFLAWATTFLGDFHPFTAFTRVLEFSHAKSLKDDQINPDFNGLENVFISIILCEALSQFRNKKSINSITPSTCKSTLSYACAQSLSINQKDFHLEQISKNWGKARRLTNAKDMILKESDILIPIKIIIDHFPYKNTFFISSKKVTNSYGSFEALLNILDDFEIKNNLQKYSNKSKIPKDLLWEYSDIWPSMKGPLEARLKEYNDFLLSESFKSLTNTIYGSLVCGYLTDAISPGTLDHVHVVEPLLEKVPGALIWYGFFAGLFSNKIIQSSNYSVGKMIHRNLLKRKSLLNPPDHDLSINELEILFVEDNIRPNFVRDSNDRIIIEIFPGVTTMLKYSQDITQDKKPISPDTSKIDSINSEKLDEFGQTLRKLNRLYYQITEKYSEKSYRYSSKRNYGKSSQEQLKFKK